MLPKILPLLRGTLAFLCLLGAVYGQDRPNILWLTSEDNGPFIGAYGDPLAKTPTLDAMAPN